MGTDAVAPCAFRKRASDERRGVARALPAFAYAVAGAWMVVAPLAVLAQAKPGPAQTPAPPAQQKMSKPDTHITPAQAKELFASVDVILAFASQDSQLAIKHPVQRRLTTRAAVESYVLDKLKEDKDAKRLERSEIVLKKFGLLDRDFQLRPFLVSLLTEQIAGYYDNKTKTVNLLDWILPEEQKPVLAHELTHALQDQHVDLEKWGDKSKQDLSHNVTEDNQHLLTDEADTARDAVAEGQAMAVFIDYSLKPAGKSLRNSPEMLNNLNDAVDESQDSPVLARAPLLLKESLLFPYREGLGFEMALLRDEGPAKAFAGVLDQPPNTSFEIMNPHAYESHQSVPLLEMPDVHLLLDAEYAPYDIGVMGALDVRILAELFGGPNAAASLTPFWNGGLYYAVQRKAATPQEAASTGSIALLYLSQWTSADAASQFAGLYAKDLNKKYAKVQPAATPEGTAGENANQDAGERLFDTNEGPVLIAVHGKQVFISESFALPTARKLELLLTGAQAGEDTRIARVQTPQGELSGGLMHAVSHFGLMHAALRP